jgi:protein phosphatase
MLTTAAVHRLGSREHPYEDRFRLLGATHPQVAAGARGHLYAVMDGVGGAPMGMQAAQRAADRLGAFFDPGTGSASESALAELVHQVNREIRGFGLIPGTTRSLGACALTAAWFSPERQLHLLHVGDTVGYRFDPSDGALAQLTTVHGGDKTLHRYLGQGEGFRLDRVRCRFAEGDLLVLVTDGVTKGLHDEEIEAILRQLPDPGRAAPEIANRARRRGSKDDITCVVVELEEW